MGAIHPYKFHG